MLIGVRVAVPVCVGVFVGVAVGVGVSVGVFVAVLVGLFVGVLVGVVVAVFGGVLVTVGGPPKVTTRVRVITVARKPLLNSPAHGSRLLAIQHDVVWLTRPSQLHAHRLL